MPLLPGKKNVGKNIATEMKAGKPLRRGNCDRALGRSPQAEVGRAAPNRRAFLPHPATAGAVR